MDHKMLYLSEAQIEALGGEDMKKALYDVEECFKLVHTEQAIVPDKVSMGFGKTLADESTKGRINAMPGYIGGEYDMAGIKWIGSNPMNANIGLPRASAITILNDPDTKFPVCMMNGSMISAVRTGASTGVAARYLARKDAKTIVLVGAGYQNRKQLEAVYCSVPSLENFFIVDISAPAAEQYAKEMGEKLGITITPLTSLADLPMKADISINATSAPVPVMDLSVANPGSFHACVGGLDHPDLYKKADKIICDAWPIVRHRGACYLALDGLKGIVKDEDIYAQEIGEILCGEKPGRESDEEFIYYKPVGLGILDIAIASRIYREAKEQGIGTVLDY